MLKISLVTGRDLLTELYPTCSMHMKTLKKFMKSYIMKELFMDFKFVLQQDHLIFSFHDLLKYPHNYEKYKLGLCIQECLAF